MLFRAARRGRSFVDRDCVNVRGCAMEDLTSRLNEMRQTIEQLTERL